MPFHARQVAFTRPAAVAVHDDGDVPRQPVEFDLARQFFLGPAFGNPLQQLIEAHGVVLNCTDEKAGPGLPGAGLVSREV